MFGCGEPKAGERIPCHRSIGARQTTTASTPSGDSQGPATRPPPRTRTACTSLGPWTCDTSWSGAVAITTLVQGEKYNVLLGLIGYSNANHATEASGDVRTLLLDCTDSGHIIEVKPGDAQTHARNRRTECVDSPDMRWMSHSRMETLVNTGHLGTNVREQHDWLCARTSTGRSHRC